MLAILYAARTDQPAALDRIIGFADFINHAIPTAEELNATLPRLVQANLIAIRYRRYAPTQKAEAMFISHRGQRTRVYKDLEWIQGKLISLLADKDRQTSSSRIKKHSVTEEHVRRACLKYTASINHGRNRS